MMFNMDAQHGYQERMKIRWNKKCMKRRYSCLYTTDHFSLRAKHFDAAIYSDFGKSVCSDGVAFGNAASGRSALL